MKKILVLFALLMTDVHCEGNAVYVKRGSDGRYEFQQVLHRWF